MKKQKRKRKYRIEEAAGDTPSEMALIVVHLFADLEGIAACATEMYTPALKRLHVIFDNRIPTPHIRTYLANIMKAMPNMEYIVKFTESRTLSLIGVLWYQMCDYCEKRSKA